MDSGSKKVETGVDELLKFLQGKEMVDIKEAAKELGVSQEVIQLWIDFLVEEKIIGVEYKFTKPYIYLIQKAPEKTSKKLFEYQKIYENSTKKIETKNNNVPVSWKAYLLSELEKKKEFFIKQAAIRNIEFSERLWEEYKQRVGL